MATINSQTAGTKRQVVLQADQAINRRNVEGYFESKFPHHHVDTKFIFENARTFKGVGIHAQQLVRILMEVNGLASIITQLQTHPKRAIDLDLP